MSAESLLIDLRNLGWMVAVHNDYKLNGDIYTFWLFTSGKRCAKGEGRTNEVALQLVLKEVESQNAQAWADNDRMNDIARVEVIQKKLIKEAEVRATNAEIALSVAGAAFAKELAGLRAVIVKLRDALPSKAVGHGWPLTRTEAYYLDPANKNQSGADYQTQTIDGEVMLAARAAADEVLR